ncbi:MAG TPA: EamA family transporter [Rubrivivax sp.]|nr:EamA family transporter [Rubrivivax sp.]
MEAVGWLWIPIVLLAAAAQTVRNAAQKDLGRTAGTLAATSVRFVYGLPFALLGLAVVFAGRPLPAPNVAFLAQVGGSALAQLIATALLLAAMQRQSFIVAVAYSKTEVLQVAMFSAVLLGEQVSAVSAAAIVLASIGLWLLSVPAAGEAGALRRGWWSSTAWMGIGSGAGFALSAVGYRAAAQALGPLQPWESAAYSLVWAQGLQSVAICAALALWRPDAMGSTLRAWRVSTLAGACGALASFGWFTAFAMRNAADVRTLALVEVLYGYLISRRVFAEQVTRREKLALMLLTLGIAAVSAQW